MLTARRQSVKPLAKEKAPSSYNLSVSLRSTAPLVGEPLAKPFTLRGLPKPPLLGATATTAASGGNREELLGQRPAGCERQRSRRWEPQPGQWQRVSADGEVVRRRACPRQQPCKPSAPRLSSVRNITPKCKAPQGVATSPGAFFCVNRPKTCANGTCIGGGGGL